MKKFKLLIVDDMVSYVESLRRVLSSDYEIVTALSVEEVKQRMSEDIDLLLVDIRLDESKPDDKGGVEVLRWVKENFPNKPVVMMSAYRDFDAAVECVNLGAEKFLKKPIDISELKQTIKNILEKK